MEVDQRREALGLRPEPDRELEAVLDLRLALVMPARGDERQRAAVACGVVERAAELGVPLGGEVVPLERYYRSLLPLYYRSSGLGNRSIK